MRSPFPRLLTWIALSALAGVTAAGCTPAEDDAAATGGEGAGDEGDPSAIVPITEPDETAPASDLELAPLDRDAAHDLVDVRGVGDSGWSNTHEETPIAAEIGAALDRFDRTQRTYRGDLTFVNWETVIGSRCTIFGSPYSPGRSYAFVSRPENLDQLDARGFNLIGLSNNHTRDCWASPETTQTLEKAGPAMTAAAIAGLGERPWLTAGLGSVDTPDDFATARVRTFRIKGRDVRVAFGSFYTGRPSCPITACKGDATRLFESLRDARADLRIVAIHSMAAADQEELVRLGIRFVKDYGGDVVFGHGPHVWKPVRVVRKNGGGAGVVFESLGNFLHPSLAAQSKNVIGRALFDGETFALRQVQLVPVKNVGRDVTRSTADARTIASNLRWTSFASGVWANVKR